MVVAQLEPMVCLAGRWDRAVVLVLLAVSTQCCLRLSFCCRHLLLMNLFGEACESRCGRERRCPLPNKKGRPEETGSAHVSAGSWLSRSQFLSGSLAFGQLCSPCVTQNHATQCGWYGCDCIPGKGKLSNPILVGFFVVAFDGRWDSSVFKRLIRELVRLDEPPTLPIAHTKTHECALYSMALTQSPECQLK